MKIVKCGAYSMAWWSLSLWLCSTDTVSGSVVSVSTSRLPMSLSSVISDLEAEGVSQVSTATFLASRSVTQADRSKLFQSLFYDGDGDSDEEDIDVEGGEATALGKLVGGEGTTLAIAVANPAACGVGGAAEAAMTVLATHGTVIFICNRVDLERGEGLFQDLAPAMERLLLQKSDGEESSNKSAELIVIFQGISSPDELERAKEKFERAASSMLSTIVKPRDSTSIDSLRDVFDTVEFTTSTAGVLLDTLMEGKGQLLEPWDAAASVASAVASGVISDPFTRTLRPKLSTVDLAAVRRLQPVCGKILTTALDRVQQVVQQGEEDDTADSTSTNLIPNFGDLVDATVRQALADLDASVADSRPIRSSMVTKRKRADLVEQIYADLSDDYANQLVELEAACFEQFRKGLSTLRVSPTLPNDMEDVVSKAVLNFITKSKSLRPKGSNNKSTSVSAIAACTAHWASPLHAKTAFKKRLTEYCTDRLNAARVSGNYRPVPRKGVTIGLHWLLPKPFGNDYRQNPLDVYRGQLFYSPTQPTTEVDPEQVKQGTADWRRTVVPVPAGSDMMFQPGTNN